jgi:hypothetical protein
VQGRLRAENPPLATVNTHLTGGWALFGESSLDGPMASLGRGKSWTKGGSDNVNEPT